MSCLDYAQLLNAVNLAVDWDAATAAAAYAAVARLIAGRDDAELLAILEGEK